MDRHIRNVPEHRAAGTVIDDFDLMIRAMPLRFDLTLLTRNVRHFAQIQSLRVLPTPGEVSTAS